jgi:hypothetical protein
MSCGSARKDRGYVFPTRLLSFARDCFFVGRNGLRAGPARAICPTGANSQSQQFAGRPAAASGSGLAGGPAGIARRIRIQRIRNGRVLARHQRGSQSAAQCAAPFPSTPARSALNQTRRYLSWQSSPPSAASSRVADSVAERCDAATRPESGEKRKLALETTLVDPSETA